MTSPTFKIATWNVNSIRSRLSQLLDWLNTNQPDIVALQETKVTDELFPVAALKTAGYHVFFAGQKAYNGVAVLSRIAGDEMVTEFPTLADPQRRVLAATYQTVRVVNLYIPNGESLESEKYRYKLNWLQHLHRYVQDSLQRYPRLILLGDFNIAPQDEDVHDPQGWAGQVMVSAAEREALQGLLALGLRDTFRLFEQPEKSFSWWDYRAAAFRRNLGARIDLILASTALSCIECRIDKTPRGWERPSDHTPVIATFDR